MTHYLRYNLREHYCVIYDYIVDCVLLLSRIEKLKIQILFKI